MRGRVQGTAVRTQRHLQTETFTDSERAFTGRDIYRQTFIDSERAFTDSERAFTESERAFTDGERALTDNERAQLSSTRSHENKSPRTVGLHAFCSRSELCSMGRGIRESLPGRKGIFQLETLPVWPGAHACQLFVACPRSYARTHAARRSSTQLGLNTACFCSSACRSAGRPRLRLLSAVPSEFLGPSS